MLTLLETCDRMLSLNLSQESEGYWQNVWKILIYDSFGRDIIAPLYTVEKLHQAGVTLHMYLLNRKLLIFVLNYLLNNLGWSIFRDKKFLMCRLFIL